MAIRENDPRLRRLLGMARGKRPDRSELADLLEEQLRSLEEGSRLSPEGAFSPEFEARTQDALGTARRKLREMRGEPVVTDQVASRPATQEQPAGDPRLGRLRSIAAGEPIPPRTDRFLSELREDPAAPLAEALREVAGEAPRRFEERPSSTAAVPIPDRQYGEPGDFERGLRGGLGFNVTALGETIEQIGASTGREDIRERGERISGRAEEALEALGPAPSVIEAAKTAFKSGDPRKVVDWAQYALGQAMGSTLAPVVGGVAGGAAATAMAGPGAAPVGAAAGALAPSYGLMLGEIRSDLERVPDISQEDIDRIAPVVAIPAAALEALLPGRIGSKLVARTSAALARRIALGLFRGGRDEALTEMGQTFIGQATRAGLSEREALLTWENLAEQVEAGAAGFVGGMGIGGPGAVLEGALARAEGPQVEADPRMELLEALAEQDEPTEALAAEPIPEEGFEAPAPVAQPRPTIRRRVADLIDPTRAQQIDEAFRDPMTGLPNPSAFRRAQPRWDADPERRLLGFDLIGLKAANDIEGEAAGNELIRTASHLVYRESLARGVDPRDVMRAGGDEFGVGSTLDEGVLREIGEAVQAKFPQRKIGEFTTGIRFGVGSTWAEADNAMAAAKAEETGPKARDMGGRQQVAAEPIPEEGFEAGEVAATPQRGPITAEEALGRIATQSASVAADMDDAALLRAYRRSVRRGGAAADVLRAEMERRGLDVPGAERAPEPSAEEGRRRSGVEVLIGEGPEGGAAVARRHPEVEPGKRAVITRSSEEPDFDELNVGQEVEVLAVDDLEGTAEIRVAHSTGGGFDVFEVPLDVLGPAPAVAETPTTPERASREWAAALSNEEAARLLDEEHAKPEPNVERVRALRDRLFSFGSAVPAAPPSGPAPKARLVPKRTEGGGVTYVAEPITEAPREAPAEPTKPIGPRVTQIVSPGIARQDGKAAFEAGERRVVPSQYETAREKKAWYAGWDTANYAAPVPELIEEREEGAVEPVEEAEPTPGTWFFAGSGGTVYQVGDQYRVVYRDSRVAPTEHASRADAYRAAGASERQIEAASEFDRAPAEPQTRPERASGEPRSTEELRAKRPAAVPEFQVDDQVVLREDATSRGFDEEGWGARELRELRTGPLTVIEAEEGARTVTVTTTQNADYEMDVTWLRRPGDVDLERAGQATVFEEPSPRGRTPQETFADLDREIDDFVARLDALPEGSQFTVEDAPGARRLEGTWTQVRIKGDPFWLRPFGRESPFTSRDFMPVMGQVEESLTQAAPAVAPPSPPSEISQEPTPQEETRGARQVGPEARGEPEGEPAGPLPSDEGGGRAPGAPRGRGRARGADVPAGVRRPEGTEPAPGERLPAEGSDAEQLREPGRGVRDEGTGAGARPADTEGDRAGRVHGLDYRITDDDQVGEGGVKTKAKQNLEAVRVLKSVLSEGRQATRDEQAILVKYAGWGGMPQAFDQYRDEWQGVARDLKGVLTPEEYESARASTPNAHYTSPTVVRGIWDAIERLGFDGGRVLEPSAGVGHFLGFAPKVLAGRSRFTAVELDKVTGEIAQALYPKSDVRVTGFERAAMPDNFYDLAVSNVPFGDYGVHDPAFKGARKYLTQKIHDYFFARALDKVRPGGLVAFITSKGTMDKADSRVREYLVSKADLLGAIRLPNTAFKANANTEVTTDIIFLRKREEGVGPTGESWTDLAEINPLTERSTVKKDVDALDLYAYNINAARSSVRLRAIRSYLDRRGGFDESMTDERAAKIRERLEERLREDSLPDTHPSDEALGIKVNEYFARHPEMMLGTMELAGTMYRAGEPTLIAPEGQDLAQALAEAVKRLPEGAIESRSPTGRGADTEQRTPVVAPEHMKEGAYVVQEGNILVNEAGHLVPAKVKARDKKRITALIGLRDAARRVLHTQIEEMTEREQTAARKELNRVYDAFVKKYGFINKRIRAGKQAFRYPNLERWPDPDRYLVSALEKFDEETEQAAKAPILSRRVVRAPTVIEKVDSAQDGMLVVLSERGRVDLGRVAQLMGSTPERVREDLRGLIYENPETGEFETEDAYLSGNVRRKLDVARGAAEADPMFKENVEALEKVQPEDLTPSQIEVALGASWVPASDVKEFAESLFAGKVAISHIPSEAVWKVRPDGRAYNSVAATSDWGTNRANGLELLESALNLRMPKVYDTVDDKRVLNETATLAAQEKQNAISQRFGAWLWEDQERAERLVRVYNDERNAVRRRVFNGDHLTFEAMSSDIELDPHQKAVVWRILQVGNTLMAHAVGAGKTFASVAAGMEAKRLGLASKPMYAVPNHMLEQFSRELLQLYPTANIIVATKEDFQKKNREKFMARVATGDWDAVIVTHSSFGLIPMSPAFESDFLRRQLAEYEDMLVAAAAELGNRSPTVKELERAKKKLETRIKRLEDKVGKDQGVTFEELGVDMLFVDEAHMFKNLATPTKIEGIGIVPSGRAFDLYMKSRYLEQINKGRGLVLMTGTPVSRSMMEAHVMQRYLQEDTLREKGLLHFDAWGAEFGHRAERIEQVLGTKKFRKKTRFAYFMNVPELMQMFGEVADIQTAEMLNLPIPKLKGGKATVIASPGSPDFDAFIAGLEPRLEAIKRGTGMKDGKRDNMLWVSTDGQKAALDMRLVDPGALDFADSRVNKAVENIHRIWHDTSAARLTQVVFLDSSTPTGKGKGGFNLYDDMKAKLVGRGVPAEEIAFIHDAGTDQQKQALFDKVNRGSVRILIGSTLKMGVGTNIQKRLVALHHMEPPWNPSDVEQREGRILRQGNENEEVEIFRYVTEARGSFDAWKWDTLERKAGMIGQVMKGDPTVRRVEDVDEVVLSYAEAKALATGDPLVLEKANVDADVGRLTRLHSAHEEEQYRIRAGIRKLPDAIARAKATISQLQSDIKRRVATTGDAFRMKLEGADYNDRTAAAEALVALIDERAESLQPGQGLEQKKIGEIAGFHVHLDMWAYRGAKFVRFTLRGEGSYVTEASHGATSGMGWLQRLEHLPNYFEGQVERAQTEVAQSQERMVELEKRVGKPFAKQEELDRLLARQLEIDKALGTDESDPSAVLSEGDQEFGGEADEEVAAAEEGEEDTDEPTPDSGPDELYTIGLSAIMRAFQGRTSIEEKPILTSAWEEVEERYQKAKGVKSETLVERAKEGATNLKHDFTRSFPLIDSKASVELAATTDLLRQIKAAPEWAKSVAYDRVSEVVGNLDAVQVDLMTRVLVTEDIQRDVEEGRYGEPGADGRLPREAPFGYEFVEQVDEDVQRYRHAARSDSRVWEALRRRREFTQALTRKLVDLDLLSPEVLKDDRYYHRQVMQYVNARRDRPLSMRGRDVRLRKRGFQMRRVGGGDFNTAYQEAEFEWVEHALSQIARKEALERIRAVNDIKSQLKRQAKAVNEREIVAVLAAEAGVDPASYLLSEGHPLTPFRSRIAMSAGKLTEMAEAGELYSEGGRFEHVIDSLRVEYEQWQVDKVDAEAADRDPGAFMFSHPEWFPFLSHLIEHELPGAQQAATIFKAIREREEFLRENLAGRYATWESLVPEGWEVWQPERGRLVFPGLSVQEQVIERVLAGEEILDREDVRAMLVLGGPKEQWVVPEELAATLDDFDPGSGTDDGIEGLWVGAQSSWKQWILLNPVRVARYNLNNLSGDLDIALAYNPRILKYFNAAARDLWRYHQVGGSMVRALGRDVTPLDDATKAEIQETIRLGVTNNTLSVAEIPDISQAGVFKALTNKDPYSAPNLIDKWWGGTRNFTTWRENILRLAAYRFFRAELEAGKARYGASEKHEVDAIKSRTEKAAKLARELIGDYGNISNAGKWLRRHLVPFWSWQEINAPRYLRMFKNLPHEEDAGRLGQARVPAVAAAALARKTAVFALKVQAFYMMVWVWNHLLFPDETDELEERLREMGPQLILGRNEDGEIRSIPLPGALSDALSWIGLQDWPEDVRDVVTGAWDLGDKVAESGKAVVDRVVNMIGPMPKTLFELTSGHTSYPSIYRSEKGKDFTLGPRPIRDRWEHAARTVSLEGLYRRVTNRPYRPMIDVIGNLVMYRTDPGESAYYLTREKAARWLEQQGRPSGSFHPTDRSNALYYFKKASDWGEDERAAYWLTRYHALGGTDRGLTQSLERGEPLGMLARRDRNAFLATLSERDREALERAESWYDGIRAAEPGARTRQRRERSERTSVQRTPVVREPR